MERWHLTLLLGLGALAAAILAPALHAPAGPDPGGGAPPIPRASASGPLSLDIALDPTRVAHGSNHLQHAVLTITAPQEPGARAPVDLALLVDTSGSMGQEDKIVHAREAAYALVDALVEGDHFSLVTFDDAARVVVPGAPFDGDRTRLRGLIAGLRDDGGTNLSAGIEAGHRELSGQGVRKLLVVSDGNPNMGDTDPAALSSLVEQLAAEGTSVSTIGLGRDFNESLLATLADAGGGAYHFVGDPAELAPAIAGELSRTTRTVARGARVVLTPRAGVTITDVYGWTERSTGGFVTIDLGDFSAGETKKLVVALDAPSDAPGASPVLAADLEYTRPDGAVGTAEGLSAAVDVESGLTSDPWSGSDAAIAVARAQAGELVRAAADAWRDGDSDRATSITEGALRVIAEAQAVEDSPELRADAAKLAGLQSIGRIEGGSYAAKAASEVGRDLAR